MQSLLLNIFMNMKKTNKRMINKPYLINDSIKKTKEIRANKFNSIL